jgi:arylsulfatase A-like enzyme
MLRSSAIAAAALATLATASFAQTTRPAGKPNVILIITDDMGSADIGVQGAPDVKTPHIDALAKAGTRFTNAYASCPVCSPTRAGLMTGKYQQRFGHEQNPVQGADLTFGLPKSETTMADRLKAAGYRTGFVGKWHLGNVPGYFPMERGFDEYFGFLGGLHKMIDNAEPEANFNAIQRDQKPVGERAYLTDAFSRESVAFIERNRERPFFLYLAYNAPHVPLQVPPKYRNRFPDIKDDKRLRSCAMMAAVDDGVGQIAETLKKNGLGENTVIFFMSDNGGDRMNGSSNAPLRGYKGETYEGGIRVPFLVRWDGTLPAGKVDDRPIVTLDVLPTALAAAGASAPSDLDGRNLLPFLKGEQAGTVHEALYWRFGPRNAMRAGQWKLQWNNDEPRKLFDLSKDVGEQNDLAGQHPDVVKKMQAEWNAWSATLAKPLWEGRLEGGEPTTKPAAE